MGKIGAMPIQNTLKSISTICLSALLLLPLAAKAKDPCPDWGAKVKSFPIAICQSANVQPSTGKTVRGRTIYFQDTGPVNAASRVLVIGTIHGDEQSSASLAFHWLNYAQKNNLNTHWRFIPIVNPDSLMSNPSRRTNANGVDLNRNFPTPNWDQEAKKHWTTRTRKDPRRFPGNQSLSEPESKFIVEQINTFKPTLIVSIHAPYGVLDFDGPKAPPKKLGFLYLDQVGIFPGSLGNYSGVHRGIPVVTVELPNALEVPPPLEITRMWTDLTTWMNQTFSETAKRP